MLNNQSLTFRLGDISDWEKVEKIYIDAFPVDERQMCDTIRYRLVSDQIKLFVVDSHQSLVGFALVWVIKHIPAHYIEYLAIMKEYRSKGIGEFIISSIKKSIGNENLIVEIEDPAIDVTDIDKTRRYQFYQKNHFELINNINYKMPALNTENKAIPMLLLCYSTEKKSFSNEFLTNFVEFLFLTVYQKEKNNFYLRDVLKSVLL